MAEHFKSVRAAHTAMILYSFFFRYIAQKAAVFMQHKLFTRINLSALCYLHPRFSHPVY
jgi:hypothetical protein